MSNKPLCRHDWVGDDDCAYCKAEHYADCICDRDMQIQTLEAENERLDDQIVLDTEIIKALRADLEAANAERDVQRGAKSEAYKEIRRMAREADQLTERVRVLTEAIDKELNGDGVPSMKGMYPNAARRLQQALAEVK